MPVEIDGSPAGVRPLPELPEQNFAGRERSLRIPERKGIIEDSP
jgi:hypothetical protein